MIWPFRVEWSTTYTGIVCKSLPISVEQRPCRRRQSNYLLDVFGFSTSVIIQKLDSPFTKTRNSEHNIPVIVEYYKGTKINIMVDWVMREHNAKHTLDHVVVNCWPCSESNVSSSAGYTKLSITLTCCRNFQRLHANFYNRMTGTIIWRNGAKMISLTQCT